MYFFLKNVWKLQKNSYLCNEFYAFGRDIRACPRVGGRLLTSMERDLRPFVRPVSKGRFRTLLSVIDKSSKFESTCSGDATESVHVG